MLSVTWPPRFALPFDHELARRLLACREFLDLSRPQLARVAGISVDKIYRLESGSRRCLIADADLLLVTMQRLAKEREARTRTTPS